MMPKGSKKCEWYPKKQKLWVIKQQLLAKEMKKLVMLLGIILTSPALRKCKRRETLKMYLELRQL